MSRNHDSTKLISMVHDRMATSAVASLLPLERVSLNGSLGCVLPQGGPAERYQRPFAVSVRDGADTPNPMRLADASAAEGSFGRVCATGDAISISMGATPPPIRLVSI